MWTANAATCVPSEDSADRRVHLVPANLTSMFHRVLEADTTARVLRTIFADGAHHMLTPLVWRMDKDWRPTRRETPWTKQLPSTYLRTHVRFCADRFEMPDDPKVLDGWLEITGAHEMLLFASNYPYWDSFDPREAFTSAAPGVRERILSENARALYKFKPGATTPGGQAGKPGPS